MPKTNSDRLGNRTPSETTAPYAIPAADLAGKLSSGWGGAASGLATLDGSSLVVQNPANATATPTASKIPIADGSGKLDGWVTVALTKYFESAEQTITSAGTLTIAHGLGGEPKLIQVWLVCKSAEGNYSVNDKTPLEINMTAGGVSIVPDSTNLNIRFSNAAIFIHDKTTGNTFNITYASWKMIFRAWA